MIEQDLVKKLKRLKKVQPSQEWLTFTRHNLINRARLYDNANSFSESTIGFWGWLKQYQAFALVGCLLINIAVGPWLIAKASRSSLPGELLYSIKKVSEGFQTKVASEEDVIQLQVEFANRRLEELNKIAEKFATEKKSDTIGTKKIVSDFKSNLAGVSLHLKNNISKEKAVAVAEQTQKINQDLIRVKEDASEDIKADLAEAEKSIEDIKFQILAVLMGDSDSETIATSSDEEILIYLKGEEKSTTTECIILDKK
ncbi:DUF5667 domain-containing protein [Patescibacteria group bacterium]